MRFITRVARVQLDEGLVSHIAGLKLPDDNVWFERAESDKSIVGEGRVGYKGEVLGIGHRDRHRDTGCMGRSQWS